MPFSIRLNQDNYKPLIIKDLQKGVIRYDISLQNKGCSMPSLFHDYRPSLRLNRELQRAVSLYPLQL